MDIYQHNIELLKENRPKLYELYQKAVAKKEYKYPCEHIQQAGARDGSVIFTVTRDGIEKRLNSPYHPLKEAERWASQFHGNNVMVNAMLFGFGNGMFAGALLNLLKEDAKLFVYEPNLEIFNMAMKYIDLQDIILDDRVLLFLEDINPKEFEGLLRENTHWTNLETQICCHHTGYEELFPEAYRDFLITVKKTSEMVQINKDTQAYFAKKMVPNMLKNMKFIRESRFISDYVEKIPKDIPAIIVAAGPSLDKNIDRLKEAKGKAFILAVDTAMRQLLKHDIVPDAMVTLDAAKPFSYMQDPALREIPLFCILESNHEIMEFHEGVKIWFQGSSFLDKLFEKYDKKFVPYSPGGSVATAAFMICASLEFERIVFVGQDLAYQGDITHAGGEVSHVLNEDKGIKMIDGIDGKPIRSRHDWIIYRDWFEESIEDMKDKIEVIDATEGGALIHGTKLMSLQEVIEDYCHREVDVVDILNKQDPVFNQEEYARVQQEIQGYVGELKEIREKAQSAEKVCDKALKLLKKEPENRKITKLQQKVLCATEEIADYTIYDLVDIYMSKIANKYLSGVFVVSDDSHKDEVNMYLSSKMIFQDLAGSADKLLPLFEEAAAEV